MAYVLDFDVDLGDFTRDLSGVEWVIAHLVDLAAHEVSQRAESEGSGVASSLGEPWEVEGSGPWERHVQAPVWWAHFLAGGTADHGPVSSPALVFEVSGGWVRASFVKGIPAEPFDQRAVDRARSTVPALINRALEAAV